MSAASPADAVIPAAGSRDPSAARKFIDAARKAEAVGDRWKAIEELEKAFEQSPDDEEVCFSLAYHMDLVGEEAEALHLYEQAVEEAPAKVNALMNLAILYEDMCNFVSAEKCLRQVLATDPNHRRARLYMKDVMASRQMYYDEDQAKQRDKHNTLLETPVTDFELSVRARNCLKKMNIRSLGDLLRTTEAELLAYKNFGETSLTEIKAMLAQKGLRLGQGLDDQRSAVRQEVYEQLADDTNADLLNQAVTELELSVRSRKALSLLGIHTMADLCSRTEAELMGIKNFGATSLSEIKQKLAEKGLGLRKLDDEQE